MNRSIGWLFLGGFRGCMDTPGADTGGGAGVQDTAAADAGGGGAEDSAADAGADTGAGDAEPSDDDLLFEQEEPGANARTPEEQIQALKKANNRLRRRFGRVKPLADRLKDVDVDRVMARASRYDELEAAIQRNPKLRALLGDNNDSDDDQPTAGRDRTASASKLPPLPTEFTADTLGFDPNESPANRVLANAIAHVAQLAARVEQLAGLDKTVKGLDQSFRQRTEGEARSQWKAGLDMLTEKVKAAMPGNELLLDAVTDAYKAAYLSRAQHGRNPQQVVDHYLAKLVKSGQVTKKQADTVSAGVKAGIAERNRQLPKSPAGGGTAANVKGDKKESLRDVHKRIRQRLAAG